MFICIFVLSDTSGSSSCGLLLLQMYNRRTAYDPEFDNMYNFDDLSPVVIVVNADSSDNDDDGEEDGDEEEEKMETDACVMKPKV